MKTAAEHVANVLAVAIWADGEYDEDEQATVSEIAEALGFTPKILEKLVQGSFDGLIKSSDEKVNEILQTSAKAVLPSEKGIVYEAAIEIVLSDSVIGSDEISCLLEIAIALELDTAEAIRLIADAVNPEKDVDEDINALVASAKGNTDKLASHVVDLCEKILDPETFVIEK